LLGKEDWIAVNQNWIIVNHQVPTFGFGVGVAHARGPWKQVILLQDKPQGAGYLKAEHKLNAHVQIVHSIDGATKALEHRGHGFVDVGQRWPLGDLSVTKSDDEPLLIGGQADLARLGSPKVAVFKVAIVDAKPELGLIALLESAGLSTLDATGTTILYRFLTWFLPIVVGTVLWWRYSHTRQEKNHGSLRDDNSQFKDPSGGVRLHG
jgi:hypothetical protein